MVTDDMESVTPWRLRGIKIFGTAEIVDRKGAFVGPHLRTIAVKHNSWGIERAVDLPSASAPRS
jgi:hypothetical protein